MIEALYVETSSLCNLSCVYCYRTGRDYSSKNRNMPLGLFKKIVADCVREREALFSGRKPDIFLHSYGEPTLNPHLEEMVATACGAQIFAQIRFVSNLLALAPERYRAFFDAGLTGLYFSLDSLDPGHVSATRRGTDLERLLESVTALAGDYADKLCPISVLTTVNKDELPRVGAFLHGLGMRTWNIQLLNTRKGRFGLDRDVVSRLKDELLRRFSGMTINFEEESIMACRQPFTTLEINAMGYLTPCCSMTNHDVTHFGNVAEASLAELCFGEAYAAFREEFRTRQPKACANCPYYLARAASPS